MTVRWHPGSQHGESSVFDISRDRVAERAWVATLEPLFLGNYKCYLTTLGSLLRGYTKSNGSLVLYGLPGRFIFSFVPQWGYQPGRAGVPNSDLIFPLLKTYVDFRLPLLRIQSTRHGQQCRPWPCPLLPLNCISHLPCLPALSSAQDPLSSTNTPGPLFPQGLYLWSYLSLSLENRDPLKHVAKLPFHPSGFSLNTAFPGEHSWCSKEGSVSLLIVQVHNTRFLLSNIVSPCICKLFFVLCSSFFRRLWSIKGENTYVLFSNIPSCVSTSLTQRQM